MSAMSENVEPRRVTGPWDEKIVRAWEAYQATKDSNPGWGQDLDSDGRRAAKRNAQYIPGEPATMYIGSDSYRMLVVDVDRFKSGAKQGEVKAIHVVHLNHDDTPRPQVAWDFSGVQPTYTYEVETYTRRESRIAPGSHCWRHTDRRGDLPRDPADTPDKCYACWERQQPRFIEKGQDHCSLVVGYAEDYRDPHF